MRLSRPREAEFIFSIFEEAAVLVVLGAHGLFPPCRPSAEKLPCTLSLYPRAVESLSKQALLGGGQDGAGGPRADRHSGARGAL